MTCHVAISLKNDDFRVVDTLLIGVFLQRREKDKGRKIIKMASHTSILLKQSSLKLLIKIPLFQCCGVLLEVNFPVKILTSQCCVVLVGVNFPVKILTSQCYVVLVGVNFRVKLRVFQSFVVLLGVNICV